MPSLAAIAGNLFWGSSFIFTRVALRVSDPLLMLSVRFVLATVLMTIPLVMGKAHLSLRGKRLSLVLMLCLTETLGFFFETFGVQFTNATYSGFVPAIVPIVAMLVAIPAMREYPTKRQAFFSIFPIIGVVIMTVSGRSLGIIRPIGALFLLATCLFSSFSKITRRRASQAFTPFETTYLCHVLFSVVFTAATLFSAKGDASVFTRALSQPSFLYPVLALSLLSSVGANLLINYAAKKLTVAKLAVYGTLSAPCSMLLGLLFLREPMNLSSAFGAALILFGIWQFMKPEKGDGVQG